MRNGTSERFSPRGGVSGFWCFSSLRETGPISQLGQRLARRESAREERKKRKRGRERERDRPSHGDCAIRLRQGVSVSPSFLARIGRRVYLLALSDPTASARAKVTEVARRGNSRRRENRRFAIFRRASVKTSREADSKKEREGERERRPTRVCVSLHAGSVVVSAPRSRARTCN